MLLEQFRVLRTEQLEVTLGLQPFHGKLVQNVPASANSAPRGLDVA